MKQFDYVIQDALGIHARPAGMLAKLAKEFESSVQITKADKTVSATQLLMLMGLGVKQGDTIGFTIEGPDEDAAATAIQEFLSKNL